MAVITSWHAIGRPTARLSSRHPWTRPSRSGTRHRARARRRWKATGTSFGLRHGVGKNVKLTVFPMPQPRSGGERRRRPLHMCSLTFKNKWQWSALCVRVCTCVNSCLGGVEKLPVKLTLEKMAAVRSVASSSAPRMRSCLSVGRMTRRSACGMLAVASSSSNSVGSGHR